MNNQPWLQQMIEAQKDLKISVAQVQVDYQTEEQYMVANIS